jgi:YggT family protein
VIEAMPTLGQDLGTFLIGTLFSIYIMLVMLRFLLAWVRADFYNPISQAIVKLTNPPLIVLRRVIPSIGRIDTSAIVLMLVLQILELWLIVMIGGLSAGVGTLALIAIVKLVKLSLYIFIACIFIQVIISWISPGTYNPIAALTASLTDPMMRPLRRIIPPAGVIDFTPMIMLLALFVALRIISHYFPYA